MPAPNTIDEFLELVRKSGVVEDKRLQTQLERLRAAGSLPTKPYDFATVLVKDGLLTHFQAEQFLNGKWRRFTLGKYKVLERLGSGGMGSVYLCEHTLMKRRVAVKVLPEKKAEDSSSLQRFYREARAVAALDHPNIVRAYDIDKDENLHFLVMEHVDGSSLQEIVKRTGTIDPIRASHYIRQAALGLQHAHETAGLVHRDIKPGNILVDRNGIVKVLDMGLARFFHDDDDDLTKKFDENVLGTADFLAPEQALDSHGVDIRADIYSLGATFYFCLTGKTPFAEGTVAQKLIWHQTRQPKPIRQLRPDVPEGIIAIVERMMSKDPAQRYPMPIYVAEALAPFTQTPIPPPPESEMPQFSLAATKPLSPGGDASMAASRAAMDQATASRKVWQVAGSPSSHSNLNTPGGNNIATAPISPPPSSRPPAPPPPPSSKPPAPAPAPPKPIPQMTIPEAPPRPAPAQIQQRPAPAPAPVPLPEPPMVEAPEEDEELAFKPTSGERRTGPRRKEEGGSRMILWLALVGVVLIIVPVAGFLIYSAVSGKKKSTEDEKTKRTPVRIDGTIPRALQMALQNAKPGERIWLRGEIREANLAVRTNDVTIEADPELAAGKKVVWKCPDQGNYKQAKLLIVQSVSGFTMRGITLDGNKQTEGLVVLYGRCSGAKLENLTFQNSRQFGLMILNCEASKESPIECEDLTFVTEPAQSAIRFGMPNQTAIQKIGHLAFRKITFNGPGQKVTASRAGPFEKTQYIDEKTIALPEGVKIE